MVIIDVRSSDKLREVRALFQEYWDSFAFSPCFQHFDRELRALPGEYAPPAGRLGLSMVEEQPAGCIAMRSVDARTCEMKRLYVRPAYRGGGVGNALVRWIIEQARVAGYRGLYADTMPVMREALAMYERIGFTRTAPYTEEPTDGAVYLFLPL